MLERALERGEATDVIHLMIAQETATKLVLAERGEFDCA